MTNIHDLARKYLSETPGINLSASNKTAIFEFADYVYGYLETHAVPAPQPVAEDWSAGQCAKCGEPLAGPGLPWCVATGHKQPVAEAVTGGDFETWWMVSSPPGTFDKEQCRKAYLAGAQAGATCGYVCGYQEPYGFVPECGCPVHDPEPPAAETAGRE